MSETPIKYLAHAERQLQGMEWTPSRDLAISLTNAARQAVERALMLPPVDRNAELKNVADRLEALETYFRKQGADLVAGNLIFEERIRTLGLWGLEYEALEDDRAIRGRNRSSTAVDDLTHKQLALEKSGGISREIARRFVLIGRHLDDLDEWFQEVRETTELSVAKALRELRRHLPATQTPPLPEGTYATIVADPPWPMQKIERTEAGQGLWSSMAYADQGRSIGYPTMSVQDIKDLLVAVLEKVAPEQAHFYLWTTQKYIKHLFGIIEPALREQAGFKYVCTLTWDKGGGFTPFFPGFMYSSEFVMFLAKGAQPILAPGTKTVFQAPRGRHSEKPAAFYDLVLQCSPPPRLELFARRRREGFDVWGDEV